ncbi:hypothetical protein C9I50_09465 [Pseudomonas prosekii]|nr:hypothetical protein C9I50_09465 [Pseudomonas prosekii]
MQASKVRSQSAKTTQSPVGASLLAIAAAQSTSILNVTPSSRASSLPQGFVFHQRNVSGQTAAL